MRALLTYGAAEDHRYHLQAGDGLMLLGSLSMAHEAYAAAIRRHPASATGYLRLGTVQARLEESQGKGEDGFNVGLDGSAGTHRAAWRVNPQHGGVDAFIRARHRMALAGGSATSVDTERELGRIRTKRLSPC